MAEERQPNGNHETQETNGNSLSRIASTAGAVPISEAAFSINEATQKYPTGVSSRLRL